MASIVVLIESVGDLPHPASLEALGQARRIGTGLGATVYAVATCQRAPLTGQETLIEALSSHGADKVILTASPSCTGPLRWGSHGAALVVSCDLLHPSLVLVADTVGARDLAGRLAAHFGAAWLCPAWVEQVDEGLALWEGSGEQALRLPIDDENGLDFPVVAALPPGRYAVARGEEEAEVEVVEVPSVARDFIDEGELGPQPRAVVMGTSQHARDLAVALAGSTDALVIVPLAIVIGDGGTSFGSTRALTRAALGPSASSCALAHYAVEGEADSLARALTNAAGRARPQ